MTIRLFEVGGSIRDELMGIDNPPDRDFCAESPDGWEVLLAWCHANMKRVFLVTPEFFTVRGMMSNGTSIDVVMCRKDGSSSDGRHPDAVEAGTLLDDLARRDFTINALAREVNPETLEAIGDIIDPFNGVEDLVLRRLHCVGTAEERMAEDWLRLLRAVRFAVTKNLDFDDEIGKQLIEAKNWEKVIESVSVERIREELHKMFKHNTVGSLMFFVDFAPAGLSLLNKTGIWLRPSLGSK